MNRRETSVCRRLSGNLALFRDRNLHPIGRRPPPRRLSIPTFIETAGTFSDGKPPSVSGAEIDRRASPWARSRRGCRSWPRRLSALPDHGGRLDLRLIFVAPGWAEGKGVSAGRLGTKTGDCMSPSNGNESPRGLRLPVACRQTRPQSRQKPAPDRGGTDSEWAVRPHLHRNGRHFFGTGTSSILALHPVPLHLVLSRNGRHFINRACPCRGRHIDPLDDFLESLSFTG